MKGYARHELEELTDDELVEVAKLCVEGMACMWDGGKGNFMRPGRHNDDGVDLCICCYAADYDVDELAEERFNGFRRGDGYPIHLDLLAFEEVQQRVGPYLNCWWRDGTLGLSHMCEDSRFYMGALPDDYERKEQ